MYHLAFPGRVLAQQLYVVAYGEQGHVAGQCKCLEYVDALVVHGVGSRFVDFTEHAYRIVGGPHGYVWRFVQVFLQLLAYQGLAFACRKS